MRSARTRLQAHCSTSATFAASRATVPGRSSTGSLLWPRIALDIWTRLGLCLRTIARLGRRALVLAVLTEPRSGRVNRFDNLAADETSDDVDDLREMVAVVFFRYVAEMRCEHHIVEHAQWMRQRERLDFEHVDPRARDFLFLQRRQKRRLIDDGAARGIDEERCPLHPLEILGADQATRFLAQNKMNRDDVGFGEQSLFRDRESAGRGCSFDGEMRTPG